MLKGGLYLPMGDSTVWTEVTAGADLYAYLTWKAICENYSPIKHINKGLGGNTSSEMVANLYWLTKVVPDLVTIGVGMNDCADQAVSIATYTANLNILIDRCRWQNPDVHIILCTPNRTGDATHRTPYIQDYRNAMTAVATAQNVGVCHFENAYADADLATYNNNDSGAFVHPNTAGHLKIFNEVLWTAVQAEAANWLNSLG